MTAPVTTLIYAGILGLILVLLSARVVKQRGLAKVSLGEGSDAELRRRIRIQGNFIEYVPMALILIWMLDNAQFSTWVIHVLGILLIVARLSHAWSLSVGAGTERFPARVLGAGGTFLVIGVASLLCLLWALAGFRL
jgi:uncharacterized membrane protein YecN with MAPEG domain